MVSFRNFNFFESNPIADVEYYCSLKNLQNVRITSIAEGNNFFFIGDYEGLVFCFDNSFNLRHFRASNSFSEIFLMKFNNNTEYLYTISKTENFSSNSNINIWNIKDWADKQLPSIMKSIVVSSQENSNISCFDFTPDNHFLLIANSSKSLEIIRFNLNKDQPEKRKVLRTFDAEITNIFFDIKKSSSSKIHQFYLTTNDKIMYFSINRNLDIDNQINLDTRGCSLLCAVLYRNERLETNLIVARDDAVFFYDPSGKGQCFAMGGEKVMAKVYKHKIILWYTTGIPEELDESNPPEQSVSLLSKLADKPMAKIKIFDISNKFFAGEFNFSFMCGIISLDDKGIFIISSRESVHEPNYKNSMTLLTEKNNKSILEILFQKNRYDLALEFVKKNNLDPSNISYINLKHADYLYSNKAFSDSIEKYIFTIGNVDSSVIIQKFLYCNRIKELSTYLEAFHRDENIHYCTGNHTLLLLNCYTRLGLERKIIEFIQTSKDKKNWPRYDILSVIRSLRRSYYYSAAFELANINNFFSEAIDILIVDQKQETLAIDLLLKLDFKQIMKCLGQYGRVLFDKHPEKVEEILERLSQNADFDKIHPDDFIKIFNDNKIALLAFMNRLYSTHENNSKLGSSAWLIEFLLELLLWDYSNNNQTPETLNRILSILKNKKDVYSKEKVLLMCKEKSFIQGCLIIWKDLKDYENLIQYAMAQDDFDKVFILTKEYGSLQKNCYLDALKYFASKQPEAESYLVSVLKIIDQEKITTPINVLLLLLEKKGDEENKCKIGTVKEYLLNCLRNSQTQIDRIRLETSQIRQETAKNRNFNKQNKSRFVIYQQQKCMLCEKQLEVPSIHFVCDHSYHLACLENRSDDKACLHCRSKFKEELSNNYGQENVFLDSHLSISLKTILDLARTGSIQYKKEESSFIIERVLKKNLSDMQRKFSQDSQLNPFDSLDSSGYGTSKSFQSESLSSTSVSSSKYPKHEMLPKPGMNPFIEEEDEEERDNGNRFTPEISTAQIKIPITPVYQSVPNNGSPFSMRANLESIVEHNAGKDKNKGTPSQNLDYPSHLNPF